jgi:hypothetical protein
VIIAIISWRGQARGRTEGRKRDVGKMGKEGKGNFPKKFGEEDELYWGGSVFMILVERPKFKFS